MMKKNILIQSSSRDHGVQMRRAIVNSKKYKLYVKVKDVMLRHNRDQFVIAKLYRD